MRFWFKKFRVQSSDCFSLNIKTSRPFGTNSKLKDVIHNYIQSMERNCFMSSYLQNDQVNTHEKKPLGQGPFPCSECGQINLVWVT